MKFHLLSFLGLVGVCTSQPVNFNDCDLGQYYGDLRGAPQSWSREELHALIKGTHRNVLPITTKNFAGTDDVWGALIDLDTGASEGTVHLAYTDEDIAAKPFGVRYWGKEHLWPIDRGIGTEGPDYTDIHNMRPENDLSQVVRGEKFFGTCGVLVSEDETPCEEPAQGGGPDTCSCNRLYTPPRNMRGDIARALMYMDLRYDGSDPDTLDLTLTDCPFTRDRDMSYLSQMLQWHDEDPPDDKEIARNQNACRNWQGNRNPFIDYPALARSLYGQPLPLPARGQSLIYPECEAIPTSPPTPTDNTCDMMNPGDIYFFLINSVKPDSVGLFNFVNIPEGFELYVTDNAWTGSQWLTNEGIIKVRKMNLSRNFVSMNHRKLEQPYSPMIGHTSFRLLLFVQLVTLLPLSDDCTTWRNQCWRNFWLRR